MTEHATPSRLPPPGIIQVLPQAIATIAAHAATQTTGVVGMARRTVSDEQPTQLSQRALRDGVEVQTHGGEVEVHVFVVLTYGARITDIAQQVQANVQQALKQALGAVALRVGVRVQGLGLPSDRR